MPPAALSVLVNDAPKRAEAAAQMPAVPGIARLRRRHYGLLGSFAALVLLPAALAIAYLFAVAEDQFASTVAFSVHSEEAPPGLGLLGGLSGLSGASSSDTDILHDFIRSQELVARLDATLDLRALYSRPTGDSVFALPEESSIEDLVAYWNRMIRLSYDRGTQLIELRVRAFDRHEAQRIAQAVFAESSLTINTLSDIARDDRTRHAVEERDRAVERLKTARQALTEFRSRTRIVDPAADLQGRMGLLNSLQQQLAEAYIGAALLRETTRPGDARIEQGDRRIAVIRALIETERDRFGIGIGGGGGGGGAEEGGDLSALMGEYERLVVDREFAEQAYRAALTAHDAAVAEARRQTRYLAAHVQPTLAEASRDPERLLLSLLVTAALLLSWGIAVLVYYSLRDRR